MKVVNDATHMGLIYAIIAQLDRAPVYGTSSNIDLFALGFAIMCFAVNVFLSPKNLIFFGGPL